MSECAATEPKANIVRKGRERAAGRAAFSGGETGLVRFWAALMDARNPAETVSRKSALLAGDSAGALWEFPNIEGPLRRHRPQMVGLSLYGHPHKGPRIHQDSPMDSIRFYR